MLFYNRKRQNHWDECYLLETNWKLSQNQGKQLTIRIFARIYF